MNPSPPSFDHPVAVLVVAVEDALAAADFDGARDAAAELRELGVELRLLPRGHDIVARAVAAETWKVARNAR